MNILITGGGTGGHLYPGLEIAKYFRDKGHKVYYIASSNGIDKEIIIEQVDLDNIEIEYWDLQGFRRSLSPKNIIFNFNTIRKLMKINSKSKKFLKLNHIDVVIGVGGYISYPLVKEAHAQKIMTIIHEQNSYPGLVNKKLAKKVDYLTGAYVKAGDYFKRDIINVANPRVDITRKYLGNKYYEELGLSQDKKIVLFLGGSLGADTINNLFLKFVQADKKSEYQCVLIRGKINNNMELENVKGHIVMESTNELLKYIATADIVVSRGGASTILEIVYLEAKSIIIPSPNVVNNHQYYNAQEFATQGMLYMIEEKNLDFPMFLERLKELEKNVEMETILKKYDKILSLEMFEELIENKK